MLVVAGCTSAPGTATYIWGVRGGINGRFAVRPAELACDLYYDPVGYGTGPVIPTFSLGTRRFFQVMEGENQAYVTFALKLGGFRGPGTYPLSEVGHGLSFTFVAISQGDAVPYDYWSMSDGSITITSATNAYRRGSPSVVVGEFDVTFRGWPSETFRLTGPWDCTAPASTNGSTLPHK